MIEKMRYVNSAGEGKILEVKKTTYRVTGPIDNPKELLGKINADPVYVQLPSGSFIAPPETLMVCSVVNGGAAVRHRANGWNHVFDPKTETYRRVTRTDITLAGLSENVSKSVDLYERASFDWLRVCDPMFVEVDD